MSYATPKDYVIQGTMVDGVVSFDTERIIELSGLTRGKKISIPGDAITTAINKIWEQKLFSDVQIIADRISGGDIYLTIKLKERERLSRYSIKGVTNSQAKNLREQMDLYSGLIVTENLLSKCERVCRGYFIDKGYHNVKVEITQKQDDLINNGMMLVINVDKGEKIKINEIDVEGNEYTVERTGLGKVLFGEEKLLFSDAKIKRILKKTKEQKWYRFWKKSRFIKGNFNDEKSAIVAKYNNKSFRDARIAFDSVYAHDSLTLDIKLRIEEGSKYYFRNINWVGNTKYRTGFLDTILDIKKGDPYDRGKLESKLLMNQAGYDVSSLYLDQGYLFFQANPVEKLVDNDSIDIEIQIYEGKQAEINKVTIIGNTKTNDHVVLREIRTRPGQLFSRSDIIRTQRELAQLGYFNPESLGVNPKPNPVDGTVDIEYTVEERPSDQIELSGGWGNGQFVGSVGVSLTNFSLRNMFKKGGWQPIPSGDGQRLSLRGQANFYYQSLSLSFTEPWLGGKKPNNFSASLYYSLQKTGDYTLKRNDVNASFFDVFGASVGLGKRLKWPDDYFTDFLQLNYEYYTLQNYGQVIGDFATGYANNLALSYTVSRNSVDQPIYPRQGSELTLSLKSTLPYSWLGLDGIDDYANTPLAQQHKWVEYNKIKIAAKWYTPITRDTKLVLHTAAGFGFLNTFNKNKDLSPFERFYLGGAALTGYRLAGREYIAHRGYEDNAVSSSEGDPLIAKYKLELRYPFSLNPNATIYALAFAEAANTWTNYKDFNPFNVKKSTGFGLRVFLPMFGLLGLDYGWDLDKLDPHSSQFGFQDFKSGTFHFTIGMNIGEL